ncbi:hypothetical protein LMG27177_06979 [Paraburkholderia fynbosensis]|uniref:Uncharacterized protein n=1 Tax=Paraburkholderia fynbosensis TaxID=1200993 RepID=A0A6J5H283_9BURK|nr:hypothetical protein LMG27177_06979 [Paraburkholderia fynbosensis]
MIHGMYGGIAAGFIVLVPDTCSRYAQRRCHVIEVVTFKLRHNATSARMQAIAYEIRTSFRCPFFFWLESASKPSLEGKEATGSPIRTEDGTLTCSTN